MKAPLRHPRNSELSLPRHLSRITFHVSLLTSRTVWRPAPGVAAACKAGPGAVALVRSLAGRLVASVCRNMDTPSGAAPHLNPYALQLAGVQSLQVRSGPPSGIPV